jgi:hypothetical protein
MNESKEEYEGGAYIHGKRLDERIELV